MDHAAAGHSLPHTSAPDNEPLNVGQLFASTCGFGHPDGGRPPARGRSFHGLAPRTTTFSETASRNGKNGAMPAFGASFSDAQVDESSSTSGIEACTRDEPPSVSGTRHENILLSWSRHIGLTGPTQADLSIRS